MKQTGAFPGERLFLLQAAAAGLLLGVAIGRDFATSAWLVGYCIGPVLILFGLAVLRRVHVARHWPQAPGTVIASRVEDVPVPVESGEGFECRPLVIYEYQGSTGPRRSERFCVLNAGYRSPDSSVAQTLVFEYKPGVETLVHVCPTDSTWSVLRTDLLPRCRSHTWAAILGGVLVVAISVWSGWASAA